MKCCERDSNNDGNCDRRPAVKTYDPAKIKTFLAGKEVVPVREFRVDPPGTGRVLRHSFYENGHARQTCVACGLGLHEATTVPECKPFSAGVLR